jgi:hypothetical protein
MKNKKVREAGVKNIMHGSTLTPFHSIIRRIEAQKEEN